MSNGKTKKRTKKSRSKDGQTKHYVRKDTHDEWGSSGGSTKTTFGKGGRKGDKKHKEVELRKEEATTEKYRYEGESDKPRYTQTKRKKGKEDKTKVISKNKYKRKLARKTKKSIKREDDTESYKNSKKV